MADEDAAALVQAVARAQPHLVLRAVRREMRRDPEAAELVRAAIRARQEADATGRTVDQVIADWMAPAERWTR